VGCANARFLIRKRTFLAAAPNDRNWPVPAVQAMKSIRGRPTATCDPERSFEARTFQRLLFVKWGRTIHTRTCRCCVGTVKVIASIEDPDQTTANSNVRKILDTTSADLKMGLTGRY
jgi:hypothetical protein